jgi:hypothetical protein
MISISGQEFKFNLNQYVAIRTLVFDYRDKNARASVIKIKTCIKNEHSLQCKYNDAFIYL